MNISLNSSLSRRTFLRGAGVTVALPFLEAMLPVFSTASARAAQAAVPRRMVAIETNMGIMPQFFFPEKAGADYALTPYLEKLAAHRKQLTVFSGVSHPGVTGAHAAENGVSSPARRIPSAADFATGFRSISSPPSTSAMKRAIRRSTLAMTSEGGQTLSYTRSGAPIPAEKARRSFSKSSSCRARRAEVEANVEALRQGRSMLDFVGDQSKRLNRALSKVRPAAHGSVLHLGARTGAAPAQLGGVGIQAEARRSPPSRRGHRRRAASSCSENAADVRRHEARAGDRLVARIITLFIDTTVIHNITHHGNRPEVIAELRAKEEAQFDALERLPHALSTSTKEEGQSLLDRTMVLYGTCDGQRELALEREPPRAARRRRLQARPAPRLRQAKNNYPLSNLYLSMLQRLGIETNEFSTSKGTMKRTGDGVMREGCFTEADDTTLRAAFLLRSSAIL